MAERYDLVVIGSGTAASVAAKRCRAAGWSVAVVDERPFGGTCPLRGCDPKKVLVGAAEAVDQARRLTGKGVRAASLEVEWPELMAFKRRFTDPVPEARETTFTEAGIDTYHGHANLTGRNTVAVEDHKLEARHILLAAGAKPMPLGIDGEENLATSDDFLAMERLPNRILLVGGGYIALEFAHIARRAGAEVTVLERGDRFLSPFDPDLVDWLVEKSRSLGIELYAGSAVESIEREDGAFRVRSAGNGNAASFSADLVVHAGGRVPALDPRDLDAAGVDHDKGRPVLNEFLQSRSNSLVYAAGDMAQVGPPLTPVASRDGEAAAVNMLEGNRRKVDYSVVPSAIFTLPPLASVGLGEQEAQERGLNFRVNCERTGGWYVNRRVNEDAAGFKVLIDEPSGRLLGAHLLGPGADELINLFALALRAGLGVDDLRDTIFAYPTSASYLESMLG